MTAADRYRRWFEYERDATAQVVASLATVPAENRGGAEYRKAVALLGHVAAARRLWLARFGAGPALDGPLFPDHADIEWVGAAWQDTAAHWSEYLARCDDAELARVCEYRTTEGDGFRTRVEDVLTQTYGHSLYHRGQIASLVKAAGGTPAKTDFIFWCREPVGKE